MSKPGRQIGQGEGSLIVGVNETDEVDKKGGLPTQSYRITIDRETSKQEEIVVESPENVRHKFSSNATDQEVTDESHRVIIPEGEGIAEVCVGVDDTDETVWLPGPDVVSDCKAAIDGSDEVGRTLVDEFQTPLLILLAGGSFLRSAEMAQLVDALAGTRRTVANIIHSYRYDIVSQAIVSNSEQAVKSAEELEMFVNQLDSIDRIGSVNAVDAIVHTIATTHTSRDETDGMLDDLGYELASLEERDDGRFFACYLAHLVRTDGLRAAEGYVMQRHRRLSVSYGRGKTEAAQAEYWDRGARWRKLVCPAARKSIDEFTYVLANALYWSGETARTDSQMGDILLSGAATVASYIDLHQIEARAQYKEHSAKGHRHRSRHEYEAAINHFEDAQRLATEYDFLDRWEPVYNETVVRANQNSAAGEYDRAIKNIDEVLETILQKNICSERCNRIVHHLRARKLECLADDSRSRDEFDQATEDLEEARKHYNILDFERSRERISRKLTAVQNKIEDQSTPSKQTAKLNDSEGTAQKNEAKSEKGRGRVQNEYHRPEPRPYWNHGNNEFENPELNDFLTEPDPRAVGSDDFMIISDESNDETDVCSSSHTEDASSDDSDWY